jgi:hypothetical protein
MSLEEMERLLSLTSQWSLGEQIGACECNAGERSEPKKLLVPFSVDTSSVLARIKFKHLSCHQPMKNVDLP